MALNLNKNLKLYYSIKEVAEMFELNESTLRYWEQEFPFLKPKTTGPAKVRQYQEKDIEQIRLIHNLVKVRGFKLAAARKGQPRERGAGRVERAAHHGHRAGGGDSVGLRQQLPQQPPGVPDDAAGELPREIRGAPAAGLPLRVT